MKGKNLIYFASAILIITGVSVIGIMTKLMLNGGYNMIFGSGINWLALITLFGACLVGCLDIVSGTLGFLNAKKRENMYLLIKVGLLLIGVTILWIIPDIFNPKQTFNFYLYGLAIIGPLLYYLGAKN